MLSYFPGINEKTYIINTKLIPTPNISIHTSPILDTRGYLSREKREGGMPSGYNGSVLNCLIQQRSQVQTCSSPAISSANVLRGIASTLSAGSAAENLVTLTHVC